MKESLTNREQKLTQESFSTAAFYELVSRIINFPSELKGLTIVDIGAGASPAVLELQRRGAIAIAVDYRYKNPKEVKTSVDRQLTGANPIARGNKALQEKIHKEVSEEIPFGANPHLWSLAVKMAKTAEKGQEQQFIKMSRKARDEFLFNLKKGKIEAVAAFAGALPFKDNSLDFCYSLQCLSTFLLKDGEVFMGAIKEVLRVLKPGEGLKPGGQLQIQPWISGRVEWSETERQNALFLQKYLKENNIPYFVEATSPMASPRLRIIKP